MSLEVPALAPDGPPRWWVVATFLLLASWPETALGQDVPEPGEQVPAAWVGKPGEVHGFVDFRGFYHRTSGSRADWSGSELLSYFDLAEGMSGAFVLRQEVRETISRYATLMLIPQLTDDKYLVASMNMGDGAIYQPVVRLDLQLRGFFDRWDNVMYDIGGLGTWWTQGRRQFAQSNALIIWQQPWILELRETVLLTDPGYTDRYLNWRTTAIALYGADEEHWLTVRASVGNEPENAQEQGADPRRALLVGKLSVGYRYWITARYGAAAELEGFGQMRTWWRLGFVTSVFADF